MEQTARSILAANLKQYRQRAGLTVYDVGEALGKSGKTISAWETMRSEPDAETFLKLCKLYGVDSIAVFFGQQEASLEFDEEEMLDMYRQLNKTGKAMIRANIAAFVASGSYKAENDAKE